MPHRERGWESSPELRSSLAHREATLGWADIIAAVDRVTPHWKGKWTDAVEYITGNGGLIAYVENEIPSGSGYPVLVYALYENLSRSSVAATVNILDHRFSIQPFEHKVIEMAKKSLGQLARLGSDPQYDYLAGIPNNTDPVPELRDYQLQPLLADMIVREGWSPEFQAQIANWAIQGLEEYDPQNSRVIGATLVSDMLISSLRQDYLPKSTGEPDAGRFQELLNAMTLLREVDRSDVLTDALLLTVSRLKQAQEDPEIPPELHPHIQIGIEYAALQVLPEDRTQDSFENFVRTLAMDRWVSLAPEFHHVVTERMKQWGATFLLDFHSVAKSRLTVNQRRVLGMYLRDIQPHPRNEQLFLEIMALGAYGPANAASPWWESLSIIQGDWDRSPDIRETAEDILTEQVVRPGDPDTMLAASRFLVHTTPKFAHYITYVCFQYAVDEKWDTEPLAPDIVRQASDSLELAAERWTREGAFERFGMQLEADRFARWTEGHEWILGADRVRRIKELLSPHIPWP